jgi:predicted amino acid-binding ACT domain protein
MGEAVRELEYFYIEVPNKIGEGAKVLRALKDAGVNLTAFSGFPVGRRAQLDFFPADPAVFKKVARANRWKVVGPKRGFLIQGDDRVGAVADVVSTLADAKIDVIAIDAVCVDERYGALCWVAPRDRKKAAQLLGVAEEASER